MLLLITMSSLCHLIFCMSSSSLICEHFYLLLLSLSLITNTNLHWLVALALRPPFSLRAKGQKSSWQTSPNRLLPPHLLRSMKSSPTIPASRHANAMSPKNQKSPQSLPASTRGVALTSCLIMPESCMRTMLMPLIPRRKSGISHKRLTSKGSGLGANMPCSACVNIKRPREVSLIRQVLSP